MIASLMQRLRLLIPKRNNAALRPLDARRSASLSPLLQDGAQSPYVQSHSKRLFWVAGVLLALCLFVAATLLKLWPDTAPFDGIYRFHDDVWLPLKGNLWTAWYPWCLILWVPVAALVALGVGVLDEWQGSEPPAATVDHSVFKRLGALAHCWQGCSVSGAVAKHCALEPEAGIAV